MIKDNLLSAGVLLESATIVEDHLEGSRFTNAGYEWEVLNRKGDYTLVYAPLKRFQPYVVAWKLSDDGSWGQGHYFNDERSAKTYFKKVTKGLEEDTIRKSNGKWTNRGDDGTEHGEFDTKSEADAQRKAMFAQGYKSESLDESVIKYPNGMPVSSIDLDKYLSYMYGTDRDMDNSHYTDGEKQRAVDYWFSKFEKRPYDGLLDEKLEGKYPWFIGDSVKTDGTGLFLTVDGRYKSQHYTQADEMTFEDAKHALDILNSKLKKKTSMNYYLESLLEMGAIVPGKRIPSHNSYNPTIDVLSFTRMLRSGDPDIVKGALSAARSDITADLCNPELDRESTIDYYKKQYASVKGAESLKDYIESEVKRVIGND